MAEHHTRMIPSRPQPERSFPYTLESTVAFAKKPGNKVRLNKREKACGDGRDPKPSQTETGERLGRSREFGGDTGKLVPAIAFLENHGFNFTGEQYAEAFLRALRSLPYRGADTVIYIHGDHHNANATKGCGFEANTANPANADVFGADSPAGKIGEALQYIAAMGEEKVQTQILHDDHMEGAAIFVRSLPGEQPQWSVDSRGVDGEMYFVVDIANAERELADIRPLLLRELGLADNVMPLEDYTQGFNHYMVGVAAILAGGKPLFDITYDADGNLVEELSQESSIPTREAYAKAQHSS